MTYNVFIEENISYISYLYILFFNFMYYNLNIVPLHIIYRNIYTIIHL